MSETTYKDRASVPDLPEKLHAYYRLAEFHEATGDFLGPIWQSRSRADTTLYAIVKQNAP